MNENPNCDGSHCTTSDGAVRVLPLGGGANLILCHACFNHEISFRKARNIDLSKENQFETPAWNDCEVNQAPPV